MPVSKNKILVSPAQQSSLTGHMTAYLGMPVPDVFTGKFITTDKKIYTCYTAATAFLDGVYPLTIYVIKSGDDVLVCIIPKTADQSFASFFPSMLPFDPWGIRDVSELPFPNLPSVELENIKWLYTWFSSADTTVNNKLWALFCKQFTADKFPFKGFLKDTKTINELQQLNATETLLSTLSAWSGGFFYFGNIPSLPFPGLVPDKIKEVWKAVTDNVKLQGCVYYRGVIPNLLLQFPILTVTDPFGKNGLVRSLALTANLSSPLNAVAQDWPPLSEEDATPYVIKQKRNIALAGNIQFKDKVNISLEGKWPLDEDIIEISASCLFTDINSFCSIPIPGMDQLPDKARADVRFSVSKKNGSLEKIAFGVALQNWVIKKDFLQLDGVDFKVEVHHPGAINLVRASFTAHATLGKKLKITCTGNYPDGDFYLGLDPGTSIIFDDIRSLLGAPDIGLGKDLAITALSGTYNSNTDFKSFQLRISNNAPWKISNSIFFTLNDISIGIYGVEKYVFRLSAAFSLSLPKSGVLLFSGSASYNAGWVFSAKYKGHASLKNLADDFGLGNVPDALNAFVFEELAMVIDVENDRKYFSGNCELDLFGENIDLSLELSQEKTDTSFSGNFATKIQDRDAVFHLDFIKNDDGFTIDLTCAFTICGVTIFLEAKKEDKTGYGENDEEKPISKKQFTGSASGLDLHITDILEDVLERVFPDYKTIIPIDLLPSVDIHGIYISYNGENSQMDLVADASVSGRDCTVVFHYIPGDEEKSTASVYAFAIRGDFSGLDGLPLVGSAMSEVKLQGIGFVYTSGEAEFILPELSEADEDGKREMVFAEKGTSFNAGFNLAGKIELPGGLNPLNLTFPSTNQASADNSKAVSSTTAAEAVSKEKTTTPSAYKSGIKWININKEIGPIAVTKIGCAFAEGILSLYLDGSVSAGGLKVTVEGLGLSFTFAKLMNKEFDPSFSLSGLGFAFEKKPLSLSGMFLKAEPKEGEEISFYGAAQITTSRFSISGIGGYSKLTNGKTSFFIYAYYNGPIGGPSFFYITGIAAGFGYNRKIRIPELEEVREFPLVTMVLAKGLNKTQDKILSDLVEQNWIPSSEGDYWMAIGITFTSFKLIESFVLLTVGFGHELEFAIIGLSLLKWPDDGTSIVYIELAILVRFGPGSDVFAVKAMITPNSYIFDTSCKLTGGFAFYSWVSGQHEGDFVITLGGYHPKFKVPAHYPKVDRLGLYWKFSDEMYMFGEMYFALTPKAIMAGGRWEVHYDISILSAYVMVWADVLIYWSPLHYEIEAGVRVHIEADIDMHFVSIHFNITMECLLRIWGPPFAGEIYVDWSIISFTIPFGAGENELPPPLTWLTLEEDVPGFVDSFVPLKDKELHPLDTRFIGGVMSELKDDQGKLLTTFVNPYGLVLGVDSFFPLTNINVANKAGNAYTLTALAKETLMEIAGNNSPQYLETRNKEFGIKPMRLPDDDIVSIMLQATGSRADIADIQLDAWLSFEPKTKNEYVTENIIFMTRAKGFTGSLWARRNDISPVIKNILSGLEFHFIKQPVESGINPDIYTMRQDFVFEQFDSTMGYCANIDASVQDTNEMAGVNPVIAEVDAECLVRKNAVTSLVGLGELGFDLYEPASLSFEAYDIDTPLFKTSIGQNITAKKHA